ncbi:MAG: ribonuclease HII [Candidatus Njordarchaeales archaeon]
MQIIRLKKISNSNESKVILGIDEAGRGAVIGPLIMACFGIRAIDLPTLLKIPVKDSKELNPLQRSRIFRSLFKMNAEIIITKILPKEIDKNIKKGVNLNILEAKAVSSILGEIKKGDYAYIDSPSTTKSFRKYINQFYNGRIRLFIENRADKTRPIVSAASIIAKVIRDNEIKRISKITNLNFGSGYPSDPKTYMYLSTFIKKYPEFIRKSWKTLNRL